MNVSRRTLLSGGLLGAVGAIGLFGHELSESYKSDIRVVNNRSSSVDVTLTLSNLDKHKTIFDQSFTLAHEEDFRREGVFADETRYQVQIQADEESAVKEFETCCRGYLVYIYVEREELQIDTTHYD